MNINNRAQKPTEVPEGSISPYIFTPVEGSPGLYDLVHDGLYLAIDLDGNGIFTEQSSQGGYITVGDITFITSIFSYACDGTLLLGIPGIVPFEIGVENGFLYDPLDSFVLYLLIFLVSLANLASIGLVNL